ncbi:5-formyltetrahydrofolate cyclo-ligase [Gilvimarinus sp. F26214L]|uniref:5-formyltetrahydrofolate cyclo-ligase n=1 Tax=Gilvimarinus sp. DZF01 TaxID=3461371 RepID=UPI0040453841
MADFSSGLAPDQRQAIRREMRRRRSALSPRAQEGAAAAVAKLFSRQPLFQRSRRIAFYLSNDGEIDPKLLLKRALLRGKRCYLPVLHPMRPGQLWFARYTQATILNLNRYGIPEPAAGTRGRLLPATALDLVLLPLVAFDRNGGRLGMGAGFYDRTFAFKRATRPTGVPRHTPALVGLAHACQEADELPLQSWDVPLEAIATDQGIVPADGRAAARHFLSRDLIGKV